MKHLERAFDGQNQGWKYLLVFFISIVIGQTIGAIPLAIVMGVNAYKNGGAITIPENKADLTAFGTSYNKIIGVTHACHAFSKRG